MQRRKLKKLTIYTISVLVLVAGTEITLRLCWGLGTTELFQSSDRYEYIPQPNQDLRRFSNRILYNELSMRSLPLDSADRVRILGFGDSVINGGTLTDHDSLATTIIEQALQQTYGQGVRCLNVSAGSWGPDNCFAWLDEHGDLGAGLIFLVVSSHDANDNMDFQPVVGVHPNYPDGQPHTAIGEVIFRYAIPHVFKRKPVSDHISKGEVFNPGFEAFYAYCSQHAIPLLIYLHPDRQELLDGFYQPEGMQIIEFCNQRGIELIRGLDHESPEGFRDGIHPNAQGQKAMAAALLPRIEATLAGKL